MKSRIRDIVQQVPQSGQLQHSVHLDALRGQGYRLGVNMKPSLRRSTPWLFEVGASHRRGGQDNDWREECFPPSVI